MDKKERAVYSMLQIPKEVHTQLKEYCNKHGFVMGHFVSNLIKKAIKPK